MAEVKVGDILDLQRRVVHQSDSAEIAAQKAIAAVEKRQREEAPYGYVVCRHCGYEKPIGQPCGEPCV